MSKKLRGITTLVLVAVLVCMVAVPAFAATSWVYSNDFGNTHIDADAIIARRSTSGTITSSEYGNDLYISATYKYYPAGGGSLVTETDAAASYRYYAQAAFSGSSTSVNYMYNATYSFSADIYDSTGTYTYRSSPVVVTY